MTSKVLPWQTQAAQCFLNVDCNFTLVSGWPLKKWKNEPSLEPLDAMKERTAATGDSMSPISLHTLPKLVTFSAFERSMVQWYHPLQYLPSSGGVLGPLLVSKVLDTHMPLWRQNSKAEPPTHVMVIRFYCMNKMYLIFAMQIRMSYVLSWLLLSYKRIEQLDPSGRRLTEI